MKKIFYLCAMAAAFAACSEDGYTIQGTVEGATDGGILYLQKQEGRERINLDSAVIANGTFTLKGAVDTTLAMPHLLAYTSPDGEMLEMTFFLEKGKTIISLGKTHDVATGTPANDLYQPIRAKLNDLDAQGNEIIRAFADTTLTDEQRSGMAEQVETLYKEMEAYTIEATKQNIGNAVGVYLLKRNYYGMDVETLDALMPQVPAAYAEDAVIVRIKQNVERMKVTAVGQKFTDFEMQDPEGRPVKLSDYVGKGKVVLVDFWASWCGPCRQEMPNLVEMYALYKKKKNFEIVGVSLDRTAEAWKAALPKLKMTWPQMSDLKFWDCEGARLYAVSSIPHTVLIDGDGTILARGLHGEELAEAVKKAVEAAR